MWCFCGMSTNPKLGMGHVSALLDVRADLPQGLGRREGVQVIVLGLEIDPHQQQGLPDRIIGLLLPDPCHLLEVGNVWLGNSVKTGEDPTEVGVLLIFFELKKNHETSQWTVGIHQWPRMVGHPPEVVGPTRSTQVSSGNFTVYYGKWLSDVLPVEQCDFSWLWANTKRYLRSFQC